MTKFMKTHSVAIRRGPNIHGAVTEKQGVMRHPDSLTGNSMKSSIRDMQYISLY